MAKYEYKIKSTEGRTVRGTLHAPTRSEAIASVSKLGGVPIEVKEATTKNESKLSFSRKVSLKDKIIFSEQLSVMLKAGVNLVQALKGLAEESVNKTLQKALEEIIIDVEGGTPLSTALEKHPKIFSHIYCQMIRSSEKTGNIADILEKLTVQQEKENDLKGKVIGALIYPAIICVLMVGVIVIIITFIIPKLSGMFIESGVALPATTKLLLWLSKVFTQQWYLVVGFVIVLIVSFRSALKNPKGKYYLDSLAIRVPVIGSLLRKTYIARFAQNFASLAQAGVPVLEAFQTLNGVMGNSVYEQEINKIATDVENGIKLSLSIRKSKYFPGMVGQLVSVGEQSGDLAGIFVVLGNFFEKEVDSMAKNLSTLLEPIIMIVMGVVIGFILMSVLQPIYGLINVV